MNKEKNSHQVSLDLVTANLQRIINKEINFKKNLATQCAKPISHTLHVKCPLSKFLWFAFFHIQTDYRDLEGKFVE